MSRNSSFMAHLPCRNGNSSEHNGIMYGVREWIPVSTSPKGRLALAAVREFGAHRFDEVTVGGLATAAEVTTGAIYHHFGSKLGLYDFVREDVERRLLDRMEGALAAYSPATDRSSAVTAALLVGFDFAVREGFLRILGEPPAGAEHDRLAQLLTDQHGPGVSRSQPRPCCSLAGGVAGGGRRCGPGRRTRRARRVRAPHPAVSPLRRNCHFAGPFLPRRGVGDRFRR